MYFINSTKHQWRNYEIITSVKIIKKNNHYYLNLVAEPGHTFLPGTKGKSLHSKSNARFIVVNAANRWDVYLSSYKYN